MKTIRNNTRTKTLKAFTALVLAAFISIAPSFANGNGDKDKKEKHVTTQDSLMVEELMETFNWAEEMEQLSEITEPATFEVYNANDQLIFSGSKKQWEDATNKKLVMIKRKAEFLFDSDGTQIFRIF